MSAVNNEPLKTKKGIALNARLNDLNSGWNEEYIKNKSTNNSTVVSTITARKAQLMKEFLFVFFNKKISWKTQ